jgi:cysteine-S-conjugate beta-lyase
MSTFAETADRITADQLRARGSYKWTTGGPGVIGAFVAEMDFGVAPPIEAALLAAVAEVVEANGGRVFADEIHAPLVYPGAGHRPYASLNAVTAGHTVTATAASKGWNLPGLKCAQLLLSNDRDAAVWTERGWRFEHGTSTPGMLADTTAYRDGGPWLDDLLGYLDGSRALLARMLAEHLPAVGYRPPQATYLAWLDCRPLRAGAVRAGQSPAEFFLDRARVMLTDGAACGEAGRGHVRLNFATPQPILAEIVQRMGAAVSDG